MMSKPIRVLLPAIALFAVVFAAACGTVATPVVTARPSVTGTAVSDAATETPAATAEPTEEVTEAPAATVEPTEEATEAPAVTAETTEEVTEAPAATVEPTEEATEASAGGAGTGDDEEVTGDPEAGEVVFTTQFTTASGMWMCSQCHSVTPDELRLIGPGLWIVAERGETRVEGETAVEYIRNSILHPNDFIAPGDPAFPPGLMPQNYEEVLTEEQLNDLIAYLLTLHE